MTTDTILRIFKEITTIPRESGHEGQIIAYLQKFAEEHDLSCRTDPAGNVVIIRPAAAGKEALPALILQSHSDMVCEKNAGIEHDFAKDPIRYTEKEGWLIAEETTLGADCGIGMAAQLAVLADPELSCGTIEALFTTSEETGMDGAKALQTDFLTGKTLINLDSEDEGELFIGCAGGMDTTAVFNYATVPASEGFRICKIIINGGLGGHSGDDIDKNRANANKLLCRFLAPLWTGIHAELYRIEGGNKRNAIAREAAAVIGLPARYESRLRRSFGQFVENIREEYRLGDPGITGEIQVLSPAPSPDKHPGGKAIPNERGYRKAIDPDSALRIIRSINGAPHGVLKMSGEIPGLVDTSTNLASVSMLSDHKIRIATSQRSSSDSARRYAAEQVESVFQLAGAKVAHSSEYPGWTPRMDSPVLNATRNAYRKLFGKEPVVRAIHAGLECGLFLTKFPELDMISFGPTIRGVHAPGERLELETVDKFRKLLETVIRDYHS